MGSFINANCTTCDFRQQGIMFGGGFGGKPPLVPAIRKDNGEFVISDQLDDADLTFYHDASMYQGEIIGHGIEHREIMLNPKIIYALRVGIIPCNLKISVIGIKGAISSSPLPGVQHQCPWL